jgi:DNA-binding MarR family transcriptional regulator
MTKRREMLPLTNLDLLLLAILKQTPATNYFTLQQEWGLSIGATHPALAALSRANLVEIKPTKDGKAGSISLTRRGQEALEASWRMSLRPAKNPMWFIRAVTIAALLGDDEDKRKAVGTLREAAARRRSTAAKRRIDLEDFSRRKNTPSGLNLWMTTHLVIATQKAEATALDQIADELQGGGQEVVSTNGEAPKPEAAPCAAARAEDAKAPSHPLGKCFDYERTL